MKRGKLFVSIITVACVALMFAGCENIPELSPAAPPSAFTFTPVDGLREGVNALTGMKAGDFNMDGVTLDESEDEAGRDNGRFAIDGRELFFARDTDGGLYYVKFSAAGGGLTHATLIFVEPSAPAGIGYTADSRVMTGTAAFRGDIPAGSFKPQGGKPPYSYSVVDCPVDDEIDKDNASFRGGADGVYAKAALTAGTTYKVYVRVTDGEGRHYQQGIEVEAKDYAPPEFTDDDFVRFEGGLVEGMFDYNSGVFVTDRILTIAPFMLAKYEVTRKLWWEVYSWATSHGYTFITQNTSYSLPSAAPASGDEAKPQTGVIWDNVILWLNAFSEMRGLDPVYLNGNATLRSGTWNGSYDASFPPSNGYRLPCEAEWEYAARGGVPTTAADSPWMDMLIGKTGGTGEYNNKYAHTPGALGIPAPVGLLRPNIAGLYDLGGNAAEWCGDKFSQQSTYTTISADHTNVWGPGSGNYRMVRGGSYLSGSATTIHFGIANAAGNDRISGSYNEHNNFSNNGPGKDGTGFRIARSVGVGD